MSNLFYYLTPLVAGTLRVHSVDVMPPDDLTPRISGGGGGGGGIVQARFTGWRRLPQGHTSPRASRMFLHASSCPDHAAFSVLLAVGAITWWLYLLDPRGSYLHTGLACPPQTPCSASHPPPTSQTPNSSTSPPSSCYLVSVAPRIERESGGCSVRRRIRPSLPTLQSPTCPVQASLGRPRTGP